MTGSSADFFVDRHVREGRGAKIAFIDPRRRLSYAELRSDSARFAAGLTRAGYGVGTRIALLLLDTVNFPIVFWGAIRAGAVPIPINTLLPPELVSHILADSQAELLIVSDELLLLLAGARDLPPMVAVSGLADFFADGDAPPVAHGGQDIAFWLYSSGSTNLPKGVRHRHDSLRATVDTYAAQVLKIREDDVVFSAAKMFFAYGLGNAMTFPMSVGATAVLLPGRPSPAAVLALMTEYQPSIFFGVPTLYAALLQQPDIGPGTGSKKLWRCVSAGEALPVHIAEAWRDIVGPEILDGIGSTEMLHIFLSNSDSLLRYGTSGVAVPGYRLRVVDAEGRDVPDGEPGELLVHGASAAVGYWNQAQKSGEVFVGGWTYTGDKYIREPDGFYRYCGRTDDMFKVSGVWVSPFEVEGALAAHPAVLEAAVVGHEDADGLIKPRAFLQLKEGFAGGPALTLELQKYVRTRVGPWKYPRWIEYVDELPKTATGKIQRFKLRQWA